MTIHTDKSKYKGDEGNKSNLESRKVKDPYPPFIGFEERKPSSTSA